LQSIKEFAGIRYGHDQVKKRNSIPEFLIALKLDLVDHELSCPSGTLAPFRADNS
jgi:hypothetical protein